MPKNQVRRLHPQLRARMCLQVFRESLADMKENGGDMPEAYQVAAVLLEKALQICWEDRDLDVYLKPAHLRDTLEAMNRAQPMDEVFRRTLRLDDDIMRN